MLNSKLGGELKSNLRLRKSSETKIFHIKQLNKTYIVDIYTVKQLININSVLFFIVLFVGCNNYGKKIELGKAKMYYTNMVTEEEANKTGVFLQKNGFLNPDKPTMAQLDKKDSTYLIRIYVEKKLYTNDSFNVPLYSLRTRAALEVFDNALVEIDLCNSRLKTKKTIK